MNGLLYRRSLLPCGITVYCYEHACYSYFVPAVRFSLLEQHTPKDDREDGHRNVIVDESGDWKRLHQSARRGHHRQPPRRRARRQLQITQRMKQRRETHG